MHSASLASEYEQLHEEATQLAGGLRDLAQRATVYRHVFRASQGNHAFPLIAAHGALWAGGQFRFAMQVGRWLAWQYPWSSTLRKRKLDGLANFLDALRDINRRVCIDTYAQFYLTQRFRGHPDLANFVPAELLDALGAIHAACERRRPLSESQRRAVFEAHFLHEQQTIVGETLQRAAAAFDWPAAKFIALRPRVRFAYLPRRTCLAFRDFSDKQERIHNGLQAFDLASQTGWPEVERSLRSYDVLDETAFSAPDRHFAQMRLAILGHESSAAPRGQILSVLPSAAAC
jgi:hypothetical protein